MAKKSSTKIVIRVCNSCGKEIIGYPFEVKHKGMPSVYYHKDCAEMNRKHKNEA